MATTKSESKTTTKKPTTKKPTIKKATSKTTTVTEKPSVSKEIIKAQPKDMVVKQQKSKAVATNIKDPLQEFKTAKKVSESKKSAKQKKTNVLFVCTEAIPYAGTGGLGEVMGSLPQAINNLGSSCEARVILPLYESFPDDKRDKLEFLFHINVPLAWRSQYCGLLKYTENGVTYYFIDNEYYFKRSNLYGYYDDGERFAFFSRAVNEIIPLLDWKIDILHCQDWQTALVPIYYKLFYMYREGYENIKNIFTIHNIEYQGKYGKDVLEDVFGIPYFEYASIEYGGCINLMKGAIDYADAISTVSPTYAKELTDPFFSHGLDRVIERNSDKMRGILNGIDLESYNPETNKALFKNFSIKNIDDKKVNKAELQKMVSLPQREDVPLIAVISRLVSHKGLDIVKGAINDILNQDVQLIILGKGDNDYEEYFTFLQHDNPNKVASIIAYNKDISHKIYAGADMFLMPSKSEPCGLSQMMATRYATVPIVRATGGLKDSIIDCGDGDSGNGFVFNEYNSQDLYRAVERAVGLYRDYKDKWKGLMERCIKSDFSWKSSALEYIKFYDQIK